MKTNCDETGTLSVGWEEKVDSVVELNNNGTYVRKLIYIPEWYADGEDYEKGWYDAKEAPTDSYTVKQDSLFDMPFGYGIQICVAGSRGQQVQYSGAVKPGPTFLNLSPGYKIIGNCACKNLKLDDLLTNCDETGTLSEGWEEKVDSVVELNDNGTYVRKLIYVPEWYAEGESYVKGWYDQSEAADDSYTEPQGQLVNFPAGTGFQVNISGNRGQMITIKSALATDAE